MGWDLVIMETEERDFRSLERSDQVNWKKDDTSLWIKPVSGCVGIRVYEHQSMSRVTKVKSFSCSTFRTTKSSASSKHMSRAALAFFYRGTEYPQTNWPCFSDHFIIATRNIEFAIREKLLPPYPSSNFFLFWMKTEFGQALWQYA